MSFNKAKKAHEKLMSERKEVSVINKYQEALNKLKELGLSIPTKRTRRRIWFQSGL
ncbi:hypothetical protein MGH68_12105 [Erysipelothrix sp. D19-032]